MIRIGVLMLVLVSVYLCLSSVVGVSVFWRRCADVGGLLSLSPY